MRSALLVPVAVLSLVVGCTDLPGESTSTAAIVSSNRIGSNRIGSNRIGSNRIGSNRIGSNRISNGRIGVNPSSTQELLATEDGREVFSLIVSCALGDDVTLVATVDGTEFEFFGEFGLARNWISRPLDREGQGWVSACIFARVNANDVAIPISLRGEHKGLAVSADERAAWTLEEGGFYGNLFGPLDEPIQWYACRGKDQAAGESGGLVDRDCAEPDPANPGFTQCGFIYAGDCGDFAADQACESFSEHGTFYRKCHSAPLPPHHERCRSDDQVFRQVITTFVLP
jgi:hypothetical protein